MIDKKGNVTDSGFDVNFWDSHEEDTKPLFKGDDRAKGWEKPYLWKRIINWIKSMFNEAKRLP